MRSFRRILMNGLTIVSLVLCVGTCVLWGRSYRAASFIEVFWDRRVADVGVNAGKLRLQYATPSWREPGEPPAGATVVRFWSEEAMAFDPVVYSDDYGAGSRYRTLTLPLWLLIAVLAAFPCFRFAIRSRNAGTGLCSTCGYDLRATPERCPECGAVPKRIAASV